MEISERRRDPREDCLLVVNFAFDDKAHTAFIRNVSAGGLYIDCVENIPPQRAIILTYHPPRKGPIKRIGQVVWSDSAGMGIRLPEGGEF